MLEKKMLKKKYGIVLLLVFVMGIIFFLNNNQEVKKVSEVKNSQKLEKVIKSLPTEPVNFQERIRVDIDDLRKSGKSEDEIIDISEKAVEIIAEMNDPNSEINQLIDKEGGVMLDDVEGGDSLKDSEYQESLKGRELTTLDKITDDFIFNNNLPEKPDQKENDSTVIGIDSDNDGSRDDMQIIVEYNYRDYPELKESMLTALNFNQEIRKAGEYGITDQETLRKLHNKGEYTMRCEFYYAEKAGLNLDKFSYELGQIIDLQTNTRKRRSNDERVDTSQWIYKGQEVNDKICSNLPKIIQ